MSFFISDDVLNSVPVSGLHAYLKSQGWERGDDLRDRGVVYSAGNFEIFAPGSSRLGDFADSVEAVLKTLAKHEERARSSVLRDLLSSDKDLIRFRALQSDDDGSIDVNAGVELVQQSRDALLAAACSTISPRRAYRAGGNKEASDYIERVRMGQTEIGSFVVTLLSPVPPALHETEQPSLWPELNIDPFERRVTRTFSTALKAVRTAISDVARGSGIEAFERAVESGVSANLCDALSKLVGDGDGLDVSLSWARTRPTPERLSRVGFGESDAEVLREAARILREKEPRPNEHIEGIVTRLARGKSATKGTVALNALVDGNLKSVRVALEPDLYSIAVKAHESRQRISLDGDLERLGQRWKLVAPRHLEILPDDDLDEEEAISNANQ